ncbi:hypothetical protein HDV00_000007 [Rhizophlyctis rosea]|nr:hypothetical protein HDV00_000007 [Rhizophlyctis rosea]
MLRAGEGLLTAIGPSDPAYSTPDSTTLRAQDITFWAQKCAIPATLAAASSTGDTQMADDDNWDDLEIPDDGLGHDVTVDHEEVMDIDDLDDFRDDGEQFSASSSGQGEPSGFGNSEKDYSLMDLADFGDDMDTDHIRVLDSHHTIGFESQGLVHNGVDNKSHMQQWKDVADFLSDRTETIADCSVDPEHVGEAAGVVQNLSKPTALAVVAPVEEFDDDFDIPADQTVLSLSKPSSQRADDSRHVGTTESDLASDWGDTMDSEPRGGLAGRRFMASPTPSSNASVIASESEDETFDDIEFPAAMETLRFQTKQLFNTNTNPVFEEDEKEDPLQGLEIPEAAFNTVSDGGATNVSPVLQLKITPSAASSPSRIPRRVTSLPPTSTSHSPYAEHQTVKSHQRADSYRSTNRIVSTSNALVSSVSHLQRLSTQLIQSRSSGKDGSDGPAKLIRRPKGGRTFGDGTELDGFDDLPVNAAAEQIKSPSRQGVGSRSPLKPTTPTRTSPIKAANMSYEDLSRKRMPLRTHGVDAAKGVHWDEGENRRPHASASNLFRGPINHPDKRSAGSRKKKPQKKPTLIRNLNARDIVKVVGSMVYNPTLQKWEGNEEALLDFDRATPARPALITNKGGSKLPHTVGQMVFDPVKMCWIGNDEDVDVFAGVLSEEEMEKMSDLISGPQSDFDLSKSEKEAIYISESAHKLYMAKWYPKAVTDSRAVMRDTSKAHLYEIRSMTQKRKLGL